MSNTSKRLAIGIVAAAIGFAALPSVSIASDIGVPLIAQADDTKGKSDPNNGRPAPNGNQPNDRAPVGGGQPPSSTLQNAPQSGVPARCASVADATERQKCMNTPKGQ